MSYNENPEDIIKRKEFQIYNLDREPYEWEKNIIPKFVLDDLLKKHKYLQLHSYQLFIKNFINPNTPWQRLFMKWDTGTGKTIGALGIALPFIDYYRREYENGAQQIGSVFILGFTERIFKNELLRYPDFGFISREELSQLNKLRQLAAEGTQADIDRLYEMNIRLKKRITNRKGNGFFRFFGYKAFVNRIFITDKDTNLNTMSEDDIRAAVKSGKLKLNTALLDEFKNSLIICDEIHNVYNSLYKNNWGIAIQTVLDHHPSVRAVFLSATPLNNSPTEVIDLLNLLTPKDVYLSRDDFFTKTKELKPGALKRIGELSRGRISFLRDVNPIYFPARTFSGEVIKGIPFLKFIRCKMTPFHYKTYKEIYTGTLAQDSQYIMDIVLPNTNSSEEIGLYKTQHYQQIHGATDKWKEKYSLNYSKNKVVGEFFKAENLKTYSSKYYKMIEYIKEILKKGLGKTFIYHNIVHISGVLMIEEILRRNDIIDTATSSSENTLCSICGRPRKEHKKRGGSENNGILESHGNLYHPNGYDIVMSYSENDDAALIPLVPFEYEDREKYIKFVADKKPRVFVEVPIYDEPLRQISKNLHLRPLFDTPAFMVFTNGGSVGEYMKLKNIKKESSHSGASESPYFQGDHEYKPARYIIAHSEIDKNRLNANIEKFNLPSNAEGFDIKFLIGSKIIKESYDIKAVQNVMIMGRPDNIPTLIQIIGRAVRKNSHVALPRDKWRVNIQIYVSSEPDFKQLTYEEQKYKEKMEQYKIIQNIERIFHENAIDAPINYKTIFPKNTKIEDDNVLEYKPNIPPKKYKLNELNLATFGVYYAHEEIKNISWIIKRLFIEVSTVFNYKDLWKWVQDPPFSLEFDPQLFQENNFIIALQNMVWSGQANGHIESLIQSPSANVLDRLFDPADKRIILPKGQDSVIVQKGEYYILFPVDNTTQKPQENVESCYRIQKQQNKQSINIQEYLENVAVNFDYDIKKEKFYKKWRAVDFVKLEPSICDYGTDFHLKLIEECIEYVFNVWTSMAPQEPMHDFYFKILYYYDVVGLVIWGHTAKDKIRNLYKDYFTLANMSKLIVKKTSAKEDLDKLTTSGVLNLLKTSIYKSTCEWCPDMSYAHYKASLARSEELYRNKKKIPGLVKKGKAPADLIPIGHLIGKTPKFYLPSATPQWFDSPDYAEEGVLTKENDIIVGYDEKSKTGIHVRFKLRNPIQNIYKYKDTRMIEKGSVCQSKNKIYLLSVAEKLGLEGLEKRNVPGICTEIRARLIYNELMSRKKKQNVKWFYFSYEARPETVI